MVWYYPNWESYLDENGSTYYYNDITKETKWDPRELEDIETEMETQGLDWENEAQVEQENENLMEERIQNIENDPLCGWKELASIGKIDVDAIESLTLAAQDVIVKVSEGSMEPEILYQLPWAYKLQQLSMAVKDCYIKGNDFFDSSKYDNCNDVPRYDDGGLVQWWGDLEDAHVNIQVIIDSGVIGQESEKYTEEMKRLQAIAASGNEEDILEGFLARKFEVDAALTNLRARYPSLVTFQLIIECFL